MNKPDPAADELSERLGGESGGKFENGPEGREFDAIGDQYVGSRNPRNAGRKSPSQPGERNIRICDTIGRTPYSPFGGEPGLDVIARLEECGRRFGIDRVIDKTPLG
ncbi:restriction endonuclease fold toxin [Streptomyces sp. NBC_01497]|uniref:restriction endonuclease fold toxin n=1 Tax=Streptomyces sp. NBC_01497 TaxID=2903885 RepID=UPI002E31EA37|nr:restriction endonuclease fold toxin [Streptomyces sp. NBC_01497]